MSGGKRLSTDGGKELGNNPFAALSAAGLPSAPAPASSVGAGPTSTSKSSPAPAKNRGRVDITREKAGRGGRTVTVVSGFVGIGLPEKEALAKKLQKACGVGGTVKEGRIEIQGDKRDEAARILLDAGFRPVFAGG